MEFLILANFKTKISLVKFRLPMDIQLAENKFLFK